MNKTKDAIRDFIGKSGQHDTTVHESVSPAIKKETVKQTEHEDVNTAINKEIHQDHYHRTIQPVHDKEVLPEQHEHRVGAVQHRDHDHRDHEATKRALAKENEQFKDERVIEGKTHTQSHGAAVEGEHIHHHVHETVQPVIHKETIQPNVVHTTVPIHETHHNPAQHHSTSALPAMSMHEFEQQGSAIGGSKERFHAFEGEPKTIRGSLQNLADNKNQGLKNPPEGVFHGDYDPLDGGSGHHQHQSSGGAGGAHTHGNGSKSGSGGISDKIVGTASGGSGANAQREQRLAGQQTQTQTQQFGSSSSGGGGLRDTTASNTRHDAGYGESTASKQKSNPSLLDKLNPMVDSNGDGKSGFMK